MTKRNEKFSNRVLNTPECKVVVKRTEISHEKITTLSMSGRYFSVQNILCENGFDFDKKIDRYEDLEKNVIVYEQKKFVIPKRKKI